MIVDDQGFNIDAVKIVLEFSVKIDVSICDSALNGLDAIKAVKNNIILSNK